MTDTPGPGHNTGGIDASRLRSLVERLERLAEERKALGEDFKDVMLETKSAGFNPKAIRVLLRNRAQDKAKAEALQSDVDIYEHALGD